MVEESNQLYLVQFQPLIHSYFFPALLTINWNKSDIFFEGLKFNRKNSKKITMTKLIDFDNIDKNKYSLKEQWQN